MAKAKQLLILVLIGVLLIFSVAAVADEAPDGSGDCEEISPESVKIVFSNPVLFSEDAGDDGEEPEFPCE